MRILTSVLILVSLSLFISCSSDEEEEVTFVPDNFQPVGAGSTWSYSDYPCTYLYTLQMTGAVDTFNHKPYYSVISSDAGFTWVLKENGNYYRLVPNGDTVVEFNYLKDNVPVNTEWSSTYSFDDILTTYRYTLIEYNVPKLINGVIFENCIGVKEDVVLPNVAGQDSVLISSWKYYYANNVGLIYIDRDTLNDIYLKSYVITK